jgi:hypothetical protein
MMKMKMKTMKKQGMKSREDDRVGMEIKGLKDKVAKVTVKKMRMNPKMRCDEMPMSMGYM